MLAHPNVPAGQRGEGNPSGGEGARVWLWLALAAQVKPSVLRGDVKERVNQ
jgi:hypothetical protein